MGGGYRAFIPTNKLEEWREGVRVPSKLNY